MDFEKQWKAAKVDYKHLTDVKKPDGKKRDGTIKGHTSSVEGALKAVDKAHEAYLKALEKAMKSPGADPKTVRGLLTEFNAVREAANGRMAGYDKVLTDEMKALNRDDKEIMYRAQKVLKKIMDSLKTEMDEVYGKLIVGYEALEARAAGGEPEPEGRKVQMQEKKVATELSKALVWVGKLKAELVKNIADPTKLKSQFAASELVCGHAGQEVRLLAKLRDGKLPNNIDMAVDSLIEHSRRETMGAATASAKEAAQALKVLNADLKELADWAKNGFQL